MSERFALYFAPDIRSQLWNRACRWFDCPPDEDRRSSTGLREPIGLDTFLSATRSARRYGFHATLKPPMRLVETATKKNFLRAVEDFAATLPPVDLGLLELSNLHGFLALMPDEQTRDLSDLAAQCVKHFDPFRAELTDLEKHKHRAPGLNPRQEELLAQYGYPYVLDDFRLHFTLTDRLAPDLSEQFFAAANDWFADALSQPYHLDRLVVFHEAAPGERFTRLADFSLMGTPKELAS